MVAVVVVVEGGIRLMISFRRVRAMDARVDVIMGSFLMGSRIGVMDFGEAEKRRRREAGVEGLARGKYL